MVSILKKILLYDLICCVSSKSGFELASFCWSGGKSSSQSDYDLKMVMNMVLCELPRKIGACKFIPCEY